MKKLIEILNTFVLLSSATTSVVSCFEEDDKKSNKKHKNDEKDNEENNDNNNEETSQSLEFIIEQIKKLITIANVKANDNNTIFELTNEVKTRISKIIQDKPVNFELTIDQANEVKLEEKSYQYTIDLKQIASQNDEEANNSLTDTFSIVVKNEEVDLEKQQAMKQLEQLAQEIEKQLSTKTIIADGINTYKTEKEKIETELKNLALSKNIILQIDFINSIFKADDEIIYQIENPFELKVDLFWKENNQFSLSKVYKIASASGVTKEFLENMKNKDSQYDSIREVIKNLFADENFTNKISGLVNVKANGDNTVKDVIVALNKLTNADVFGKKEEISKCYFKYAANSDANKKIVANENIAVDVAVFDQQEANSFFTTNFDLKILGESDLEKYERISAKIEKHLNNKELDLSNFKELDADGKIQWDQTLSQIIKPDKIHDYFNFNILGSDFKSEYADLVEFDLKLDPEKLDDLDNTYFTYSNEQHYAPIQLKIFKKGTSDVNYKEKNVDLKIKVGGLTDQQLYQKQEEAAKKLKELIENKTFEFTEDTFKPFWNNTKWEKLTYKNMITYYLNKNCKDNETILEYLDLDFSIISHASLDKHLTENNYIFNLMNYNTSIEIKIAPKGKENWKNNILHNATYSIEQIQFFDSMNSANYVALKHNDAEKENLKQIKLKKQDAFENNRLTVYDLWKKMYSNLQTFISKSDLYNDINEHIEISIEIFKDGIYYGKDIEKCKKTELIEGTYKYGYIFHRKSIATIGGYGDNKVTQVKIEN